MVARAQPERRRSQTRVGVSQSGREGQGRSYPRSDVGTDEQQGFSAGALTDLVGWAKRAKLAPAHHVRREWWAGASCARFAHPTKCARPNHITESRRGRDPAAGATAGPETSRAA